MFALCMLIVDVSSERTDDIFITIVAIRAFILFYFLVFVFYFF